MSETNVEDKTKAVQTDRESQEFGAQHGQDIEGKETGSSSPTAVADEQAPENDAGQTSDAKQTA